MMKKRLVKDRGFTLKARLSGFTLIELMLVMVILGILVVIGIQAFSSSQMKGRDTKRKGDLKQISVALEAYYNDKGRYPGASADGKIAGCGVGDVEDCEWEEAFTDKNGTIYMVQLPGDRKGGRNYYYESDANGTSYQLYARLENTDDIDVPKNVSDEPQAYSGTECGTDVVCNFGVASANLALTDNGHSLVDD